MCEVFPQEHFDAKARPKPIEASSKSSAVSLGTVDARAKCSCRNTSLQFGIGLQVYTPRPNGARFMQIAEVFLEEHCGKLRRERRADVATRMTSSHFLYCMLHLFTLINGFATYSWRLRPLLLYSHECLLNGATAATGAWLSSDLYLCFLCQE